MKHRFPRFLPVILALCLLLPALPAAAEENVVFTKQPQGGEADNFSDFVITWETSGAPARFMLQTRENETYDWGNVDWITSPYTLNNDNYSAEYRLMAERESDGELFYSEPFAVTWRVSPEATTASLSEVTFEDLPLGYADPPALPITVTNTGDRPLKAPSLEMGYGGDEYFEIVVLRTPSDLPAGASDSETWAVRPRPGLGVGDYHELFYLSSISLETQESAPANLTVVESDAAITYSLTASDVDFGTLPLGYQTPADITVTVRATGTAALTKVHLKQDENNTSFFVLHQNHASIDRLNAGTSSGTNWYVTLNGGLAPGEYEATYYVYAAEVETPATFRIRARVLGEGETVSPETASGGTGTGEETGSSGAVWWIAAAAAGVVIVGVLIAVGVKRR